MVKEEFMARFYYENTLSGPGGSCHRLDHHFYVVLVVGRSRGGRQGFEHVKVQTA